MSLGIVDLERYPLDRLDSAEGQALVTRVRGELVADCGCHLPGKPTDVVIVGRSLGGAVAVDVAASQGARGLVLERTFSSAKDVGARAYPWIPVRLLMRTKLDSHSKIADYQGPLLQTHGTADRVVPIDLGRKLFEAAASSNKQFVEINGGGHNDGYDPRYWAKLREFLWSLPAAAD